MAKILVIEDGLDVRACIIELLEVEGFEVIAAETSPEGIRLARELLPDLILCDVMMPELDGYEVLTALRQQPITETVPFVFLTAKATKSDLRYGMELGADDYLTKPFTRSELLGAIATRLAKRKAFSHRYATDLSQATESLNQLAYYDSLTGLPNRLMLSERFHQVLAETDGVHLPIPVLYLDISQFRRVNSTLGYELGDYLLRTMAERLQAFVGSRNLVVRLGDDEFAIVLGTMGLELSQTQDIHSAIARVAQNLLWAMSQPFTVQERTVFLTGCLGIAVYPEDGNDIDTLIRHADIAMHEAKSQGSSQFKVYRPITKVTSDQLAIEADLRYALKRSELQVYYQPQINLKTKMITGAEALLRWKHPQRGMISPAEFIPLAEATGLIVPIGAWVLQTACQQTKLWQAEGFDNLQIAVNLSAHQFGQPKLCEAIARTLQRTGLDPALLDLELTESALVQDVDSAIETLKQLRSLSIRVSVDDFGTGYSSLSYLQRFPFNTLKIDRTFVKSISQDAKNGAITTAIIQMAHQLQLQVIAEGVETPAELAFLSQHDCDLAQGYLFSPPVSAEAFTELLHRQTLSSQIY
ncbi:EAL domain-containing protein [Leptolyngbya sp. FACHB-541]|uniref:EAL domain-containing response regulator n=1 Tax=Leptolyngbya sp. FACHB-541 TaxID=2692810 RepID=UPI001682188F|nr:GGDEF domain-containing response regulator [Leptolyngbya sp. FACHB-541]MBD1998542.1 EAL domain-containing protein [Leptolyngbya sp. FACHB-541]